MSNAAASINLIFRSVTVKAGVTVQINQQGSIFFCKSTTAVFGLSVDGGQEIDMDAGWQISIAPLYWTTLLFHNRGATDIVVSYYLGSAAVAYASQQLTFFSKNSGSYTKATGILALADGASSAAFNGLDGANVRKQIAVSNHSAANSIYFEDGSADIGLLIPAQQSMTIETNGSAIVKNVAGGGASSYSVLETFYS